MLTVEYVPGGASLPHRHDAPAEESGQQRAQAAGRWRQLAPKLDSSGQLFRAFRVDSLQ
jgi:hypothetical protein